MIIRLNFSDMFDRYIIQYNLANMEKDKIILLEYRGLISITGKDSKSFLQNIITNDVEKISSSNTIFSALLTPQGKYLFEFFLIASKDGYLLDCDENNTREIIKYLTKYKLRSDVELKDISSEHIIGIMSLEKFNELQKIENMPSNTIVYRNTPIFIDPRNEKLGARILSRLEKLHLTMKKLNLKIIKPSAYNELGHSLGIPTRGSENLKEKLFGLEANFEELNAIDFKKGCYIGQENTARMKLKSKLRRKLLPIICKQNLKVGDEIKYKDFIIGKVLINKPLPFALIKLFDPNISELKNKSLHVGNNVVKIGAI